MFDFGICSVAYDPNGSWHVRFHDGTAWDGWLNGEHTVTKAVDR